MDALTYSTHKFASNVVEIVIYKGDEEIQKKFLDAFTIKHKEDGKERHILFYLAKDRYGNYVVQQLFKKFPGGRKRLADVLKLYTAELKGLLFSKHIIYKLFKHGL